MALGEFTVLKEGDVYTIVSEEGVDTVTNVEEFVFGDTTLTAAGLDALVVTITDVDLLLVGGVDNDKLTGGGGADTIHGGDGNDTIFSGAGNDRFDGGAGTDQAHFRVASTEFTVTKQGEVYTIVSVKGVDTLTNVEEFVFSDTTLSAEEMDARAALAGEMLDGTAGHDTIFGGRGDDTITGFGGNDLIDGGADNDSLEGDFGDDSINAGAGADQARFGVASTEFTVSKSVTQEGDVYTIVSAEGVDTLTNVEEFVFSDRPGTRP